MIQGLFEKIKVYAYNNPDYGDNHLVGIPFVATINPENYVLDYEVKFAEGQGQGTTSTSLRFSVKPPEEMSFEFLFDATGIIDGIPRLTVHDEVEDFKKMLLEYDSASHEPKYFKVVWGHFIFKGRCNALTITYKLFNENGSPIRAVCKAKFKGSIEEALRVAIENAQSPDLTHYQTVKQGDTLPLMCYKVYGDSSYYIQVAKVNGLAAFRKLDEGAVLIFPPITKQ
jgi:phage tail protein X